MPLSSNKVTSFTFLHANQSNKPNPSFASSDAFKAAIDTQATQLQTGLNGLIDALMAATAGSSGAESIGSAPIAGLTGATPYAQIADLLTKVLTLTNTTVYTPTASYHPSTKKYVDDSVAGVVAGTVPDISLTTAKYQDGSVTTVKLANASVTLAKVNNDMKNMITMGGMF